MPKHLYLFRHAEAAAKESRQEDKARELAQAGLKDSLHMGAWFREQNFHFDLLASSSAVRAEQTATLAAEGMKLENPKILLEDVLYEASVRQFLDYINNIEDAYHHVLIVGHNPVISYLAEYLTKADVGDMAAGSVAIIKFSKNSWKEVSEASGQLVRYTTPEEVAKY
ncbi:MAG: phosphohistidine phosphatase SixA [Cyclobacteriaceae bacterium]